ncbi:basic-leucine zipper transcription factor, partial [Mucor lusitanicus CBS 277.49]
RKAQNRAAQRAFRERKERHMRELEVAIKQIREQRDKLHVENEQLKADQEIMRSENWYLK